jgi:hypothetical protein
MPQTNAFETSPRLASWRRRTDLPLLVIAVGSLPLLLLEVVSSRLPDGDRAFLFAVNVLVFMAFTIDYLVELTVTYNRRLYVRTQWASLIIVVSQWLAILPALGFLGILRGARALRVIGTLSRVVGVGAASREQGRKFFKERAAFNSAISSPTESAGAVAGDLLPTRRFRKRRMSMKARTSGKMRRSHAGDVVAGSEVVEFVDSGSTLPIPYKTTSTSTTHCHVFNLGSFTYPPFSVDY